MTPKIKFSSTNSVSNLEEIFAKSAWVDEPRESRSVTPPAQRQEAIAYLPRNRAVKKHSSERAFYGKVKLVRWRYTEDMKWPACKAFTPTRPKIERTPNSEEIEVEENSFIW